eukprot:scaffold82507_cov52-Attheya_sp.AAC.1
MVLGKRKNFVRISSYDKLSRLDLAHYVKEEEWHNVTRRASNWPKEAKNLTQLPDSEDESKSEEINLCLPPTRHAVRALLEANPDAVSTKESVHGRLPLHSACATLAPLAAVKYLLDAYPEATMMRDASGALPLHYACARNASPAVIRELLYVNPESARTTNDERWLPLHMACSFDHSTEVLRLLFDAYPMGVQCMTKGGTKPLQMITNESRRKMIMGLFSSTQRKRSTSAPIYRHVIRRVSSGGSGLL